MPSCSSCTPGVVQVASSQPAPNVTARPLFRTGSFSMVLAAAAELIAPHLKSEDLATREAAAVHALLVAAIDGAAPGR
ncbi:hypothetical protein [Kitasatospora purpeofusca]|uniref:hypothetical protein n=1 Tax=Kitasatospora purpeofusca TaxID=67352 RepID=UPI0036D274DC